MVPLGCPILGQHMHVMFASILLWSNPIVAINGWFYNAWPTLFRAITLAILTDCYWGLALQFIYWNQGFYVLWFWSFIIQYRVLLEGFIYWVILQFWLSPVDIWVLFSVVRDKIGNIPRTIAQYIWGGILLTIVWFKVWVDGHEKPKSPSHDWIKVGLNLLISISHYGGFLA